MMFGGSLNLKTEEEEMLEKELFSTIGEMGLETLKNVEKGMDAFVQMQKESLSAATEILEEGWEQAEKLTLPVEETLMQTVGTLPEAQKFVKMPFDGIRKVHEYQRKGTEQMIGLYGKTLDETTKHVHKAARGMGEFWTKVGEVK